MSETKSVDYKDFDGSWNLIAEVSENGNIKNAKPATISAAQLLLIRDEIREMNGHMRSIVHFFHSIGTQRCEKIVREADFKADRDRRRRLKKNKANKFKGRRR